MTPFEMDAGHEAPTSSKGGSKGGDDALKLGFSAAAKTPDPKAHALALVLLADLWCHHKGAFPRPPRRVGSRVFLSGGAAP